MLFNDGLISTLLAGPQAVASRVFTRAFSDWAGVPRGPLGWVSALTVLNSGSYPAVGDALQLRPDDELLDLGCGSAGFLAGQADRVHRVAGIDLSDIHVGLARQRLAQRIAAGTAQIVHGDAAALPWRDVTFTVVTCMSVFEAFPGSARGRGRGVPGSAPRRSRGPEHRRAGSSVKTKVSAAHAGSFGRIRSARITSGAG